MDYQLFQPDDQEQNQVMTPPSSLQLMPNKNFTPKFIGVIVLLLVFGGTAYGSIWYWQNQQVAQETVPTFTPRANETVGWKTYTNTYFETKYPSDYFYFFQPGNRTAYEKLEFTDDTDFVGSFNRNPGTILSIQDKKHQNGGMEWPRIEARISKPTIMSLMQWKDKYLKEERANIAFPPAIARSVNGNEALTVNFYSSDTKELLEQYNFIRNSNDRIAIVACLYGDPQCDQILSTFKFTDSVEGRACGGGAMANDGTCPAGYTCKFLVSHILGAGDGVCVKDRQGILTGHVTVGPNCPVERVGVPCPVSPEAYTAREFIVLGSSQKEIARFHADSQGNYSISLSPGIYTVVSAKTGMGFMSKDLPSAVTIKAGQTTTLNFSIDTGIR